MEQIAGLPLRPAALIIGKLIPYIILSWRLPISSWARLDPVGVAVKGSYFLLLLTIVLFLVSGLGRGF